MPVTAVEAFTDVPSAYKPQCAPPGCVGASGSQSTVADAEPVVDDESVAVAVNVSLPGDDGDAVAVVDVGYGDENDCVVFGEPLNPYTSDVNPVSADAAIATAGRCRYQPLSPSTAGGVSVTDGPPLAAAGRGANASIDATTETTDTTAGQRNRDP